MEELKVIAIRIIIDEFLNGIKKGLISKDTSEAELKSLFEYNVIILYELINANPLIKAKVLDLQKQNIKPTLEILYSTESAAG